MAPWLHNFWSWLTQAPQQEWFQRTFEGGNYYDPKDLMPQGTPAQRAPRTPQVPTSGVTAGTQQTVSQQMSFLQTIGVPERQRDPLISAAKQWGVPLEILAALEKQESGFNLNARSRAGAMGAFQFMPGTARSFGLEPSRFGDPNYFAFQAQAAAQFLAQNFSEFQNWQEALLAYNVGPDKNAVAEAEVGGNTYAHDIYNIIQGALPQGAMANVLTPQASSANPNPKSQMFWAGPGATSADTAAQQAASTAFTTPDGHVLFQGTSDYDYYNMVDGPWMQVFGRHATWSVVNAFKAQGVDNVYKLQNAINALPSQIPGWSIGKYDTVKQQVDKQAQALTGRPAPDSLLKEFAGQGIESGDSIKLWFLSHGASDIPKDDYQQLWDVANKFTQGTWNTVPDPRQIYAAWKAAGGSPTAVSPPTAGTGSDLLPEPPSLAPQSPDKPLPRETLVG